MLVRLEMNQGDAQAALKRLASDDFTEPMQAAALLLAASVRQNFRSKGRFDRAGSILGGDNKWKVTQNPKPLIRQGMRGGLMGSIQPRWVRSEAWAATNKVYAAAHQYGMPMGARSSLLTHKQKAAGGIPARPFLVIQRQDVTDIVELVRGFLLGKSVR